MKKAFFLLLIGLFVLPLQVCRADWKQAIGKGLVRPGQSLGKVSLGLTRNAVRQKFGRPTRSESSRGLIVDTWNNNDPQIPANEQPFLTVYYSRNKVVQIDARLDELFLSDYFSLNNTFAQLRKRFKGLKLIHRTHSQDVDVFSDFSYDDSRSGIGFFFTADRKVSPSTSPVNVSIHRKGYKLVGL